MSQRRRERDVTTEASTLLTMNNARDATSKMIRGNSRSARKSKSTKRSPTGSPSKLIQEMIRQSNEKSTRKKRVTGLSKKFLNDDFGQSKDFMRTMVQFSDPKSLSTFRKVSKDFRNVADDKITALVAAGTHIYHNGKNTSRNVLFDDIDGNHTHMTNTRIYKEHATVIDIIFQTDPPLTRIGNWAFVYCIQLPAVAIPNTVKEIGDGAFSCCKILKKVTFPKSLFAIRWAAFIECIQLKKVDFSHTNLTVIGSSAFNGCQNLTDIKFPNTLTEIAINAFEFCRSLKEIDLSDTKVKVIQNNTFKDCGVLTTVRLPKTLTMINDDAFEGCGALKHIHLSKDCPFIKSNLRWSRNECHIALS